MTSWEMVPGSVKILYEFLAIVCLATMLRAGKLALEMFSLTARKVDRGGSQPPELAVDKLVWAACAARLRVERTPEAKPTSEESGRARRIVDRADAILQYKWSKADSFVESTKGLTVIVLLVSGAVIARAAYYDWNSDLAGYGGMYRSAAVVATLGLLNRAEVALAVATALTMIQVFFASRLRYRRRLWRRFCVASESSDRQPSVPSGER